MKTHEQLHLTERIWLRYASSKFPFMEIQIRSERQVV